MRLATATALASLALLAVDTEADAAPRYASPGGEGPEVECPQAEPCSLNKAIAGAKSNDEVIVTSGTYNLSAPAIMNFEASDVDVHGDFGGPMPTIRGSFVGALIAAYGPRARVRYLEAVNEAPESAAGITCNVEGSVERVVVRVVGKGAKALLQQNTCTSRDSLLLADGEGAIALRAYSFFPGNNGVARNVTAVATGDESIGVFANYETAFPLKSSYRLDLKNSIAAGEGVDILASNGPEGPGNVVVANSNFDSVKQVPPATVTDGGGNQSAPPLFVDPGAGDYREAPGSPTIDAGASDPLIGALDLGGAPRTLGTAPDIGAFEFPSLEPSTRSGPPGQILSLAIAPKAFRVPLGAKVTYSLSDDAATYFFVERKLVGRRVAGKCRKPTRANRSKKRCTLYKQLKGTFAHSGRSGQNDFRFSGRIGGRALGPGSYRMVGSTSAASQSAAFRIVK